MLPVAERRGAGSNDPVLVMTILQDSCGRNLYGFRGKYLHWLIKWVERGGRRMTFIPILWERFHKMNTSETSHRFCCKKLGLIPQHSFGKLIEGSLKTRKRL